MDGLVDKDKKDEELKGIVKWEDEGKYSLVDDGVYKPVKGRGGALVRSSRLRHRQTAAFAYGKPGRSPTLPLLCVQMTRLHSSNDIFKMSFVNFLNYSLHRRTFSRITDVWHYLNALVESHLGATRLWRRPK